MGLGMDIGIDLGTATVLIYVKGKGVVLREPSVVAINSRTGRVLAVGENASLMLGRTPGTVDAIRPLRDGVISDFKVTEVMLKEFIRRVFKGSLAKYFKPTIMVCVPSVITQVEQKAVEDACRHAGAKDVYLIREPIAAAIGAGIDIAKACGSMIVDIGGGTTDIAVISLCRPVVDYSLKVAGDKFDEAIVKFIRRKHSILIGDRTAEELKMKIGSAYPRDEDISLDVRGRNLITGMPATITVYSSELQEALEEPVAQIFEAVHSVLERTPPELMADISQRGIVLTGGGALLYGLDRMLAEKIGIEVVVADDAESCVAIGTGRALSMRDRFDAMGDD
ncbi:MAG: rod shape-determining protein MreB [Eubacteriales bacterium]|nr:rod shape-determining protein MreB [Eubacteriales bacterium]MDD4326804.1 rod shape-determining protein MreB [Eubacteriales bacterium]MDD4716897.1 rod shape-determining protein MreB [Eubacteriales bacterium]NCU25892.1 MreB/Mrl family cell shape determining protein [Candidatus Nomurabacteria bacterium]